MENLTGIFNTDDELNEQELLNYVSGKANDNEQHELEEKMLSSPLLNDAVEGLQQIQSSEKMNAYVHELNKQLHKHLPAKKTKKRYSYKLLSWEVLSIILVILLCLIAFAIIEMRK